MFYRPADGHGLPHNPFNAIVTPRPIGWISTRGSSGQLCEGADSAVCQRINSGEDDPEHLDEVHRAR